MPLLKLSLLFLPCLALSVQRAHIDSDAKEPGSASSLQLDETKAEGHADEGQKESNFENGALLEDHGELVADEIQDFESASATGQHDETQGWNNKNKKSKKNQGKIRKAIKNYKKKDDNQAGAGGYNRGHKRGNDEILEKLKQQARDESYKQRKQYSQWPGMLFQHHGELFADEIKADVPDELAHSDDGGSSFLEADVPDELAHSDDGGSSFLEDSGELVESQGTQGNRNKNNKKNKNEKNNKDKNKNKNKNNKKHKNDENNDNYENNENNENNDGQRSNWGGGRGGGGPQSAMAEASHVSIDSSSAETERAAGGVALPLSGPALGGGLMRREGKPIESERPTA